MPAGAIHKKVMKLAQKLLRTGKARTLRSAVRKAWREVKAKARESRKSYDRKRAQEVMRKRSKRAITLDKKKRARTPLDFETWARRPGRYDWPGVDTPPATVHPRKISRRMPKKAADTFEQASEHLDKLWAKKPSWAKALIITSSGEVYPAKIARTGNYYYDEVAWKRIGRLSGRETVALRHALWWGVGERPEAVVFDGKKLIGVKWSNWRASKRGILSFFKPLT